MIVGIDDTDTLESEGTNRLARRLAAAMPDGFRVAAVLRHQLLFDPRVPYTSHNGCASLLVDAPTGADVPALAGGLEALMRERFVPGSDPGLCVATAVPAEVVEWGRRCQRDLLSRADAYALAEGSGIHLRGIGGTEDGVIGALAAVGLAATGEDGRVVHMAGWPWPDELRGVQPLASVLARGVAEVRELASGAAVASGEVDVGKHLRPAWRKGAPVLFVEADGPGRWKAVKLA